MSVRYVLYATGGSAAGVRRRVAFGRDPTNEAAATKAARAAIAAGAQHVHRTAYVGNYDVVERATMDKRGQWIIGWRREARKAGGT